MSPSAGTWRGTRTCHPPPRSRCSTRHQEDAMTLDTRQRTYRWEDQEATRLAGTTHEGLTVLQAIGAGTLPLPPAVQTLGITTLDAEHGRVSFTLTVGEYHLNPFGIVHGGVLAGLLDTAMGCAVHSLLP